MEHARLSSLLLIALLQLSQTEISSTLPKSWYAANVINDGAYAPKPLSEIFSTQATFSPTNPIVVLPTSPTTPSTIFTTAPTNIPISTSTMITTSLGSTTERPATEVSVVPLSTERPSQPVIPVSTLSTPSTTILQSTELPQPPQPPQPPQLPQLPQFQQPPLPPSPPPIVSTPQKIQIQTAPQGSPPPTPQIQSQPPTSFLLYQQAPQNIQNYPSGAPLPSSTLFPVVVTSSISPPSTTLPPITTAGALPANLPCNTSSAPQASAQFPSFRIRMVAPVGSVTNVRIGANPSTTTTTTRRPTTRTRRRNRNNYDGCVNGCGGTRVPICASPLGVTPIDPDSLKGFPSVCHMACHNSFRRNLYEKVMDGKCGRLRTRIRPVNSNNKLKKDDLNKASYTLVQGGPTVIELSPLQ